MAKVTEVNCTPPVDRVQAVLVRRVKYQQWNVVQLGYGNDSRTRQTVSSHAQGQNITSLSTSDVLSTKIEDKIRQIRDSCHFSATLYEEKRRWARVKRENSLLRIRYWCTRG